MEGVEVAEYDSIDREALIHPSIMSQDGGGKKKGVNLPCLGKNSVRFVCTSPDRSDSIVIGLIHIRQVDSRL